MNRKIPSLDGLRAFSIALVILSHLSGTVNAPKIFSSLYIRGCGKLGVFVFFVISGYLITTLLMQEREKTGTISLSNFYVRRALRILPAAYVFTTIMVVLFWKEIPGIEIAGAYLYFQNFVHNGWRLTHLWSLSIEEQFYLVWPAICCAGFIRSRKVAAWTIALSPFVRVACYALGFTDVGRYSFTVADTLATGCLLAMSIPELKRYDRWLLKPITGVIFTVLILVIQGGFASRFPWARKFYESIGVTFMQLAIAGLIYNCVNMKYRLLNWKPVAAIGVLSYSLYLWQEVFLDHTSNAWYTAFPQNLVLAFLAALASYFLVEQPMLKLRSRLSGRAESSRLNAVELPSLGNSQPVVTGVQERS
ncbi:acyltransferase 3 [Candidatus Koribacter versatilis Ellin345]|uniref:Acyltransferase 3 n=1 Tax=Koribacter versatilis (strain Ellin345) TaxID=204669 RepID=Q1IN11_KORVE|nr:acyltransferase [Candidatus Koribacter versatilis]ABF41739.1 acyltransferase 3 [Candidatus Koribacter versatilis Ellin345]